MHKEGVLDRDCHYPPHEEHRGQKGWYQRKEETVDLALGDAQWEKRRAICCPTHYAGLSSDEKEYWAPIPDP